MTARCQARPSAVAAHTTGAGLGRGDGGRYLLTQVKVVWKYLALFVFPVGQNFDHDVKTFAGIDLAFVAALAGLVALTTVAVWQRRHGIWLLGALVLLAPSSSIVPVADLMFEHRMYLPLISLAVGVGHGSSLVRRVRVQALTVAVLLALAATTWARARVWETEETLWSDAEAKSPRKVRPKLQLARALGGQDPERAESLLLAARSLESRNPEVYTQMGALMLKQRNPYGALQEFDEALRLQPQSADAHSNRGTALFLLGRLGEAEMEFQDALSRDPCHFNARHNLVLLYKARHDEAGRRRAATPLSHCPLTADQKSELEAQ